MYDNKDFLPLARYNGDNSDDGFLRKSFSGQCTFPNRGNPQDGDDNDTRPGDEDADDSKVDDWDNVNVIVRVRPFPERENQDIENHVVHYPGEGQILVEKDKGSKPKPFTFNMVFEPESSQKDVFEHSGIQRMIDLALQGYSCTIFAYGQTGSGKTYTLCGPPITNVNHDPKLDGMMQRSFHYLFEQLEKAKKRNNFVLKTCFLEIYNEQVIDLLNPGQKKYLNVRWAKDKGFYVENLFVVECLEEDDVMAVMEEGLRNRQVAANHANENSSRSHCILTVNIDKEFRASDEDNSAFTKHGKLIFVDLAGSEKVREIKNTSMQETNKINRSLLTLGKCVSALGDNHKKHGHIPYRDSKLTKLLAESLGGNGVTLMIACISPAKSNLAESVNTLRYAVRTKRIKNQPFAIMNSQEQLILSLKREVLQLKEENKYLKEKMEFPKGTRHASASHVAKNMALVEKLHGSVQKGTLPPELPVKEVYDFVQEYMAENESLRDENTALLKMRDNLVRDQEAVCRENERLQRKLEERGSAPSPPSSTSPISGSISSSDIDGSLSSLRSLSRGSTGRPPNHLSLPVKPPHRLPDNINKELQRRKLGPKYSTNFTFSLFYESTFKSLRTNRFSSIAETRSRRGSWDAGSKKSISDVKRSGSDQNLGKSNNNTNNNRKGVEDKNANNIRNRSVPGLG